MIKHVSKDAVNLEDQKTAIASIMKQNSRIHEVVEILHIEQIKRRTQTDIKAGTMIINMATSQQVNILIQKKLLLQEMFHDVEVFHRNCLIIRCYHCQRYDHMIKMC